MRTLVDPMSKMEVESGLCVNMHKLMHIEKYETGSSLDKCSK